jgi:hypothetical protein
MWGYFFFSSKPTFNAASEFSYSDLNLSSTSRISAMPVSSSMYDFACQIAAGEKFPSLAFGFEPLHSTVLVHHSLVPKGVKLAVV